jgi:hypothetical protein
VVAVGATSAALVAYVGKRELGHADSGPGVGAGDGLHAASAFSVAMGITKFGRTVFCLELCLLKAVRLAVLNSVCVE